MIIGKRIKKIKDNLKRNRSFNAFDQEGKKTEQSMYCIVAFFQAIVARQGSDFVTLFSKTEKTPQILSQLLSQDTFRTGETIKEAGQGFENRFRVSAEDGGESGSRDICRRLGQGQGSREATCGESFFS